MSKKAGRMQDIYHVDFAEYLPPALQRDPKIKALAKVMAEQLLSVSGIIDNVLIYSRIDELPEALVDILAYDMHIDWYDYSYPLETKRELLKNSVKIHKKMGTVYAVEKALGAVYPESTVEEWFEYGGEPHHFQIICDTTNSRIAASYREIVNAVKMYKRLSSHMEGVVYQNRISCIIQTHTDCFLYRTPLTGRRMAGTYPQRSREGKQAADVLIVGTDAAGFAFVSPLAGTKPQRNRIFQSRTAQIDAETALNVFGYRNIPTGQKNAGETPQRSTQEKTKSAFIENTVETASFSYSVKLCGSARKL
nr:phage tail protein I [uncultured Marvinbryantia sp.]